MKSIIEKLENSVNSSAGLTIIDSRNDGFTYTLAIKRDEEIFVVYTTRSIQDYKKESCLRVIQVTEHIPFASVEPTPGGDFICPYLETLLNKGVRTGSGMYNLTVEELPIFQKAS